MMQSSDIGQTWEVSAWDIAQLGSFHLVKYPWGWEVAAWEHKQMTVKIYLHNGFLSLLFENVLTRLL